MKALIDKLAVEFAAELNNLGVRVAKLEKNASTIKFWGDSRLRFQQNTALDVDANGNVAASRWDQRLRVYAQADVNDKAMFAGRIMANWTDSTAYGTSQESALFWDYGYFQWTFNPSFKLAVGRQQIIAGQDLFWTNGGYDAVQVMIGAPSDNFKAKIGYGDVGTYSAGGTPGTTYVTKPVIVADLNYQLNKDWSVNGAMYWSTNAEKTTAISATAGTYTNGYPFQVYNLGFRGNLNPDFNLRANYFWNAAKVISDLDGGNDHNGWMAELWFKGADKAKVNSWGLAVNYRDMKPWSIDNANTSGLLGNSAGANISNAMGQKGWGFQANYTISKNAVLTATYEKLSRNSTADNRDLLPFYYLQLNVNF
jgi:hypothetical protein